MFGKICYWDHHIPATRFLALVLLSDLTLIDMHEAFAAQTLSNLTLFASERFAEEQLGLSGDWRGGYG